VESEDCPRSVIDDTSMALVKILREDRHAQEATGATMFGPVRSKWSAAWDDAVQISERIRIEIHNAEIEAWSRDPKN
jgi:recombinational DNA repair ATPase RecF